MTAGPPNIREPRLIGALPREGEERFCRPILLVFRQASEFLHGLFQQLRHVQK